MLSLRGYVDDFRQVWAGDPVAEGVLRLMLERLKPASVDYLPMYHLRSLLGDITRTDPSSAQRVDEMVFWFAGGHYPLLQQRFEFQPPEGGDYELAPDLVTRALREGTLVVPENGREYRDFMASLFPFFVATPLLRELLSEREGGGRLEF